MAPRSKRTEKKIDQDALKDVRAIRITIEASENNLQRLGALLQFADWPTELVKLVPLGPMPFDEPGTPLPPPALEINRPAVEKAIYPLLEKYVAVHGTEKAKAMIQTFGAERMALLDDEQLLDLHTALAREAANA
jgi:hypothetical protein